MSRHLSRKEFLEKLQEVGLMAIDIAEFLDTHPESKEALADYKKIVQQYDILQAEFIKEYGPLTLSDLANETTNTWINNPWPWERQN